MSGGPRSRPAPTHDLDTVDRISDMVRSFYGDVAQDDLLGPLFNDIARVDWVDHLPKLTLFWARALLGVQGYSGNPFSKHASVFRRRAFGEEHFARWLEMFHETIDLGWVGPNAERAKELARNVARVHSGQLLSCPIDTGHFESGGARKHLHLLATEENGRNVESPDAPQ